MVRLVVYANAISLWFSDTQPKLLSFLVIKLVLSCLSIFLLCFLLFCQVNKSDTEINQLHSSANDYQRTIEELRNQVEPQAEFVQTSADKD